MNNDVKRFNTDTVEKGAFVIPDLNWTREDWLRLYHINNEAPESFAAFISSPVQRRFCGCILSEFEAQNFLQLFPMLRIYYKSPATYGPEDLKCRVICQGYTVDPITGKHTEADMGSEPRHSFIFEKIIPRT